MHDQFHEYKHAQGEQISLDKGYDKIFSSIRPPTRRQAWRESKLRSCPLTTPDNHRQLAEAARARNQAIQDEINWRTAFDMDCMWSCQARKSRNGHLDRLFNLSVEVGKKGHHYQYHQSMCNG